MEGQSFQASKLDRLAMPSIGGTPTVVAKATDTGEAHVTKPSDTEKQNEAERQAWFQNAVNERLDIPSGYLKVAVLIVRWHEDIDGFRLGHGEEIEELLHIFKKDFKYECSVVQLDTAKKPQNTLNLAIAQHVSDHDGPHNLLIVYYTGHGAQYSPPSPSRRQSHAVSPRHSPRQRHRLELTAKANSHPQQAGSYRAAAFWDEAETPLLRSAEADVLAILDCCYASEAHKGVVGDLRAYELLAASNSRTAQPGPNSFTRALINALRGLLDEAENRNFSTNRLLAMMQKCGKKDASLHDRLDNHERHIQLQPRLAPVKVESFQDLATEQAWIKLRFSLKEERLSQIQIEELARRLVDAFIGAEVQLRGVTWVKSESLSTDSGPTIGGLATALQAINRLRRASSRSTLGVDDEVSPTSKRRKTEDGLLSPSKSDPLAVNTAGSPTSSVEQPLSPGSIILHESPVGIMVNGGPRRSW